MHYPFSNKDFYSLCAAGRIPDAQTITKFAYNGSIGASYEDIWDFGGNIWYPQVAQKLKVSSSSVEDISTGDGSYKIKIYGLNSLWQQIDEVLEISGRTQVETVNEYLRVYRAYVVENGSGGSIETFNAGDIYLYSGAATNGVPTGTDVMGKIGAETNSTFIGAYTVPSGYKGCIKDVVVTTSQGDRMEFRMLTRDNDNNEPWRVRNRQRLFQNSFINNSTIPVFIDEKTDVKFSAAALSNTADVSVSFTVLIHKVIW